MSEYDGDDKPTISSLKELLNEICYNWEYPTYDFIRYPNGYCLNKLYIERDRVSYKTNNWYLEPGVYEEFEVFYNILQMLDRNKHD